MRYSVVIAAAPISPAATGRIARVSVALLDSFVFSSWS